jgi:hypothetical protein
MQQVAGMACSWRSNSSLGLIDQARQPDARQHRLTVLADTLMLRAIRAWVRRRQRGSPICWAASRQSRAGFARRGSDPAVPLALV